MSNKYLFSNTLQSSPSPYHSHVHYLHNLSILMVILAINLDKSNAWVRSWRRPFAFWPQGIAASANLEPKPLGRVRNVMCRLFCRQHVLNSWTDRAQSKLNFYKHKHNVPWPTNKPWMPSTLALFGSDFNLNQRQSTLPCWCNCANLPLRSEKVVASKAQLSRIFRANKLKFSFCWLLNFVYKLCCVYHEYQTLNVTFFPAVVFSSIMPKYHPLGGIKKGQKFFLDYPNFRLIRTARLSIEFSLFG